MTRLLITGGSSYLGQHLVPMASPYFQTDYTYFSHNPLPSSGARKLDIRDHAAVHQLVERLQPEIIIHTIGSNRPADMANIITSGTQNIADAAQGIGARLIHISTDVVFDGQDAPYDEDAPTTPIHEYGRAKAEAELLAGRLPNHVIVRTSLIYGLHNMDRGTAWIAKALDENKPVTLFSDQWRNPVWVGTLCSACLELAHSDYQGILNVAGEQMLTRADFGLKMLSWWGIDTGTLLTAGPSDHEKWPADCTLDLTRAKTLLQTPLSGVDDVLKQHQGSR